jgi:TolA-binding protein
VSWRTHLPVSWGGCPAGWQLTRALSEGADSALSSHVRSCARCAAEWAALERTRTRAQTLEVAGMSAETRAHLAAALLGEASYLRPHILAAGRRARALPRVAAFVFVAGAAAFVLSWPRVRSERGTQAAESLASIRAVGAAAFTRVQAPPDEIVALNDGTLELEVGASGRGRHFRIVTSDAALDAPEGRFVVEARAHTLVAVRVFRGFVDVRAQGGGRAALRDGDEWRSLPTPAPATTVAAAAPVASDEPPAAPTAAPRVSHTERTPAAASKNALPHAWPPATEMPTIAAPASAPERASFEKGWQLLRAGQPKAAAAAFHDVDRQTRGTGIAEDALFWESVALARGDQRPAARSALASFIARYPRSARVGEASTMLGWMLLEGGELAAAREAFSRATNDRVDRVRASAESGLARLRELSPTP